MDCQSQSAPSLPWPALAQIRHSRNITIDQIEELTKIRRFYIEAIENGELEKLPGGIYNPSYVRQYARTIDFDEEDLLARVRVRTPLAQSENHSEGEVGSCKLLRSRLRRWLDRRRKANRAAKWQLVVSAFGKPSTR